MLLCFSVRRNRAGFSWWEAWGPWWEAGPSGVFGISERDWLSNYRVLKIEGFGGRPPVGGRPGARGPPAPSKSGPEAQHVKKERLKVAYSS